jgi:hypothetical protein
VGVAQISDDIVSVTQVVGGVEDPEGWPILRHDLEHVTGLLRALAWMDLPKNPWRTTGMRPHRHESASRVAPDGREVAAAALSNKPRSAVAGRGR